MKMKMKMKMKIGEKEYERGFSECGLRNQIMI